MPDPRPNTGRKDSVADNGHWVSDARTGIDFAVRLFGAGLLGPVPRVQYWPPGVIGGWPADLTEYDLAPWSLYP